MQRSSGKLPVEWHGENLSLPLGQNPDKSGVTAADPRHPESEISQEIHHLPRAEAPEAGHQAGKAIVS